MSNAALEGRVRALIGQTFGLNGADIAGELRMGGTPGWDSMGHMDLVVAIEKEFGMALPTPRIAELVDVPSICRTVVAAGRA